MITRNLKKTILSSSKSILLLGPRQVGKSTLLKDLNPEMIINLASPSEYLLFSSQPSELEDRIRLKGPKTVLIDEIQRLPDLLNAIQVLIDDSKPKIQFFLSGSSVRKLKRGAANLLPGRLFTYEMGGFSCAEFAFQMDTQKALQVGCLPEAYLSSISDSRKLLKSYTSTYLQEEILKETLIRQIEGFSRFLSIVASKAGQFLDFSKIARQAKVHRSAARRYYEILEDTLICERVSAHDLKNLDLVQHPRFYLFDVGLLNATLDNFTISVDRKGILFEHLFFNQLRNTAMAFDVTAKITHFRTRGGLEVDFIVEVDRNLYGIEVKTSMPSESELNSLRQLPKLLDKKIKCFVAHTGSTEKLSHGIQILPWQKVIQAIFS